MKRTIDGKKGIENYHVQPLENEFEGVDSSNNNNV
jgi:hypothetical protein